LPRRTQVVAGLAVIAAIAIAVPASGITGKSIKKTVRKEVSKQLSKATGPPGAAGADGTARAYARVTSHGFDNCNPECTFDRSKGITSVTRPGAGQYCVTVPNLSALTLPAAVSVDPSTTNGLPGNTSAMIAHGGFCSTVQFKVQTERRPLVSVRNGADNGAINVPGDSVDADDVGFTIIIP
jgi:hypothetical protein